MLADWGVALLSRSPAHYTHIYVTVTRLPFCFPATGVDQWAYRDIGSVLDL